MYLFVCLLLGVFRSIGPKPSPEELAKKKTKRWWWLRELFFCCPGKKKNDFMDIISSDNKKDISRRPSNDGTLAETMTLGLCNKNIFI